MLFCLLFGLLFEEEGAKFYQVKEEKHIIKMSEDFVLTEEALQAKHNDVKRSMVGGRRLVVTDTIAGHNDLVGGQSYNIVVSGIDPSTVIDPRTMELEFEFENSGTGCFFKNNLGRLLVKRLEVMIGGTKICQNDHESMFNIFHDKWKSEAELKKMAQFGIASEQARKYWSGFTIPDSPTDAQKSAKSLVESRDRLCLKLDEVFRGSGAFYPYGINQPVTFRITLPSAEELMELDTNVSGAATKNYKLKDVLIRYDTITYNEFDPKEYEKNSGNLAAGTSMAYKEGKQIVYDQPRFVSEETWTSGSVTENILVNEPIQMLDAIVILFKNENETDPAQFENAKIEEMTVTVGGK